MQNLQANEQRSTVIPPIHLASDPALIAALQTIETQAATINNLLTENAELRQSSQLAMRKGGFAVLFAASSPVLLWMLGKVLDVGMGSSVEHGAHFVFTNWRPLVEILGLVGILATIVALAVFGVYLMGRNMLKLSRRQVVAELLKLSAYYGIGLAVSSLMQLDWGPFFAGISLTACAFPLWRECAESGESFMAKPRILLFEVNDK